jgi:8-oxo-dGTP pyrophosphatase MutT (NUDIX family)
MTEYVVVLPIRWYGGDNTDHNILLVEKQKPAWQKGRLNLVGGKVEPGETPEQAALRELEEESGLKATHDTDPDWGGPAVCGRILGVDCVIYCLNCNVVAQGAKINPREGEVEKVAWYPWSSVKTDPKGSHEIIMQLDIDKPFVNGK